MKKLLFLALTLAIPVIIFLFLKIFGENTFEVPVLFENGIPGCASDNKLHTVPEFSYMGQEEENLSPSEIYSFLIFGTLDGLNVESNRAKLIEIVRIQDAFFEIGSPKFILFIDGPTLSLAKLSVLCDEIGLEESNRLLIHLSKDKLLDFQTCGIGLTQAVERSDKLVLVDTEKRIRGIYNYNDVGQTDQLILELRILKKMM